MSRWVATALAIAAFALSSLAATSSDAVRVEVKQKLSSGRQQVILSVYATREGGSPLATESRSVQIDANGAITTPLGTLSAVAASNDERWLAVQILPGGESPRVRLNASSGRPPAVVNIVTDAAITANGIIESVSQGFRFPDGSIQTSAATVSGGVPSVNGIGSAVTIAGAGTASVSTVGSTITVTGTGLSGVTAGNGLTGGGTGSNPTLSASFGNPVSVSTSNAQGAANSVARADHVHDHGSLPGGSLHAAATVQEAGFLSGSDKLKLDSTVAYVRTIVVSPTPGNATASGTALLNAMNAISGNSSTNPYLLKIEPGVYDIGTSTLTMKEYVDIEGSGESVTFINASRGSSLRADGAAVTGAVNSEIRSVTISNAASALGATGIYVSSATGSLRLRNVIINATGPTFSYGIDVPNGASVYASNVTITSSSGTSSSRGINGAISSSGAIHLFDCSITASSTSSYAYGVYEDGPAVTIDNSTVAATAPSSSYGLFVYSGAATVTSSTLRAETASTRYAASTDSSTAAIEVSNSRLLAGGSGTTIASALRWPGSTLRIASTQIDGGTTGTPTCFNNYDANFAAAPCN